MEVILIYPQLASPIYLITSSLIQYLPMFLISANMICEKWYLTIFLICILLSEVEQLKGPVVELY